MPFSDWPAIEDGLDVFLKMGSFSRVGDRCRIRLGRSNIENGGSYRDYAKTVTFVIENTGNGYQAPKLGIFRYFEDGQTGEFRCTIGDMQKSETQVRRLIRSEFEGFIGLISPKLDAK